MTRRHYARLSPEEIDEIWIRLKAGPRLADHAACLSAHNVTPPACSSDGPRGVSSLFTRSVLRGKGELT